VTRIPPERLAELRQRRDEIRKQDYATYGLSYEEDIADIVDEIEGLLAELAVREAENKRLRGALRNIATASVAKEASSWGIALAALSPEATE